MATRYEYDFSDHVRGDTYNGATFTVTVNSVALDLTGASISATFKKDNFTYTLSTGNGLTISDAAGGEFQVDEQVINWREGKYRYDITFTLSDGSIKSYIYGTWNITEKISG